MAASPKPTLFVIPVPVRFTYWEIKTVRQFYERGRAFILRLLNPSLRLARRPVRRSLGEGGSLSKGGSIFLGLTRRFRQRISFRRWRGHSRRQLDNLALSWLRFFRLKDRKSTRLNSSHGYIS